MRTSFRVLSVAAALTVFAVPAVQAQMGSGSGPVTVALSAKKNETLTLALSASALTNTDLATSNVMGTLTATMSWTLSASRTAVNLVGWFASTDALTDGATPTATTIATSDFLGECTSASLTGGTCAASAAFTETSTLPGAVAGATRVLWTSPSISGTNRVQSAVDIGLKFAVAPTRVTTLPAGTYTGTLNLRAFAQ